MGQHSLGQLGWDIRGIDASVEECFAVPIIAACCTPCPGPDLIRRVGNKAPACSTLSQGINPSDPDKRPVINRGHLRYHLDGNLEDIGRVELRILEAYVNAAPIW